MERWAENTLRTLGIILTAGFVVVASLILVLLSMCATQSFGGASHPDAGVPYILGTFFVLVGGIWFISWQTRAFLRSSRNSKLAQNGFADLASSSSPDQPSTPIPLHLSPLGRKAIERLVLAMGAQIAVSAVAWIFQQMQFSSARQPLAHNWTLALLAPFIIYHLPYAILIYFLLSKPDHRTFAYSLAVPAVLVLQAVFSLSVVAYYFVHSPRGFFCSPSPGSSTSSSSSWLIRPYKKSDSTRSLLPSSSPPWSPSCSSP
jgi:hypothetical protein